MLKRKKLLVSCSSPGLFGLPEKFQGTVTYSSFYGRPALALDIMEEFRPLVVDSAVLTLLNNRMLTSKDFVIELGAYRLKDEQRKVFFTKFEERLNEEVSHPIFGYKTTYRRCIELQGRLLAKCVTGEIEEYPPFLVR
jgi:CRISPR-associated protein Cas1